MAESSDFAQESTEVAPGHKEGNSGSTVVSALGEVAIEPATMAPVAADELEWPTLDNISTFYDEKDDLKPALLANKEMLRAFHRVEALAYALESTSKRAYRGRRHRRRGGLNVRPIAYR